MGLFDAKNNTVPPEVAACDRELAELAQNRQGIFVNIGIKCAGGYTVETAVGTPYQEDIAGLDKIAKREALLAKRKLAVQGLRQCDKCGKILSYDSAFCNQCGEKLLPLEAEVFTDAPLCPQCKTPIEPGVHFCTKCGARIESAQAAPQPTAALRCPDCGTEYQPGAGFCMQCGRSL